MSARQAVQIELEIAPGSDPLTGSISNPTGDRIEFCGWTALAVAVERLLDDAARPANDPQATPARS